MFLLIFSFIKNDFVLLHPRVFKVDYFLCELNVKSMCTVVFFNKNFQC